MDSPPKSAMPPHLSNGPSPLSPLTEARGTRDTRDKKERESLFHAIETSNRGRTVVDFDERSSFFPESATSAHADGPRTPEKNRITHGEVDVEGLRHRAAAPTPLATSRAQSPYTQHPTIDFDGLSWPSTSTHVRATLMLMQGRRRNAAEERGH
jgi:GTP cyclohydrolase I